jgi:outer membrane immunogenic protein
MLNQLFNRQTLVLLNTIYYQKSDSALVLYGISALNTSNFSFLGCQREDNLVSIIELLMETLCFMRDGMNLFGKFLLGIGIFAASSVSVSAADLIGIGKPSVYNKEPPADYDDSVPPIGWTGFYVGGHVGSASAGNEVGAFGAHAGFNWQRARNYVIGMEGEYTALDAVDADSLASIRGKIGVVYGRSLIYGTAGVAFLEFEDLIGDDQNATGYAAGVGIDYKLKPSLSLGFDVSFYKFDDLDGVLLNDDLNVVNTLARLTFHLNGDSSDGYK